MAIQNTLVSDSNTAIYTSSGDNAITSIIVCNLNPFDPLNPNNNTYYFTLYAVPFGELLPPPGINVLPKHTIVNNIPITAGETLSLDQEKLVLTSGDLLVAISDVADQLSVTISTLQVQ